MVGVSSHQQKVVGSIPSEGTQSRLDPQSRCVQKRQLIDVSHVDVFLSLCPFLSKKKKSINLYLGGDYRGERGVRGLIGNRKTKTKILNKIK